MKARNREGGRGWDSELIGGEVLGGEATTKRDEREILQFCVGKSRVGPSEKSGKWWNGRSVETGHIRDDQSSSCLQTCRGPTRQVTRNSLTQPSILSLRPHNTSEKSIPFMAIVKRENFHPKYLSPSGGHRGGARFDLTFSQLGLGYLDLLPSPCARSLGTCILRSKIVHWPIPFVPGDSLAPEDLD